MGVPVASNDQAIPPDALRHFAQHMGATTVEVSSSHVAMVSHPNEVIDSPRRSPMRGSTAQRSLRSRDHATG